MPSIDPVADFKSLLRLSYPLKLYAAKSGRKIEALDNRRSFHEIFIVVGPEGDFSDVEIGLLKLNGFKGVALSRHTLRSETAALGAVAILDYMIHAS